MAEKKKVVQDPNAPVKLHCSGNDGLYYGGIGITPSEVPEGAIVIPSDRLVSIKDSVYRAIITNRLTYDGTGDHKILPYGTANDVTKKYLSDNKDKYESTITDAKSMIGNMLAATNGKFKSKILEDKISNIIFQNTDFVELYSELKENDIAVPDDIVDLDATISEQYPSMTEKFSEYIDNIAECFDLSRIENGKPYIDEEKFNKANSDIMEEIAKTIPQTNQEPVSQQTPATQPVSSAAAAMNSRPVTPVTQGTSPTQPLPRVNDNDLHQPFLKPDGAGNYEVNWDSVVKEQEVVPPVAPTPVPVYQPQQPTIVVSNPQTAVPPVTNPVPPVKTRQDKGDVKDAPQPQVNPIPIGGVVVRNKDELIKSNPSLKIIESKLDPKYFYSVYRIDGKYKYLDIYDASTNQKIDRMGITIDFGQDVYGDGPKFWMGSDPSDKPLDFEPCYNLNSNAIQSVLNGDEISDDNLYADQALADLNRKVYVPGVCKIVPAKDLGTVLTTTIPAALKSSKVKDNMKEGVRLKMTSYTNPKEFTLAAEPDIPAYYGGPMANKDTNHFTVTVKGGKVISVVNS